jgi:hypothetical protein
MWISWQKSNSDTYHPGPRRGAYVGTAWHRLENERNNARVVGIEATGLGLSQTRRPRRPLSFRREPSSWRCYVIDSPQRISTMTKNEILIGLSESERTKFGKEDFALQSFPQKVFSSIWAIESEVNNGGFSQFFLNGSAETVPFVADALDTIGALRTAAICRRAVERAFPDGLPATPDEISSSSAEFSDDLLAELDAIDREFLAYPDNLTDLLFAYVCRHPEEFGPVPNPSGAKLTARSRTRGGISDFSPKRHISATMSASIRVARN